MVRTFRRRQSLALALCLLGLACGARGPRYVVSRGDYRDKWPFATIEKGSLRCANDGTRRIVTFDADDGLTYGLNDSARTSAARDGLTALKPGATAADVQPLIDLALTLCNDL